LLVAAQHTDGFSQQGRKGNKMRIIDNMRKVAVNAAVHGFLSRRTWARLADRTGLREDVFEIVQLIEGDRSGNDARLIENVFQRLRCALAKEGYTSLKPNIPICVKQPNRNEE
jgi:hypothetical protein